MNHHREKERAKLYDNAFNAPIGLLLQEAQEQYSFAVDHDSIRHYIDVAEENSAILVVLQQRFVVLFDALAFYAGGDQDGGERAREVIERLVKDGAESVKE